VIQAISYASKQQQLPSIKIGPLPTNMEHIRLVESKDVLKKECPVDKYEMVNPIGQGGYGKIYLVREK